MIWRRRSLTFLVFPLVLGAIYLLQLRPITDIAALLPSNHEHNKPQTSKLHFLIPASQPHIQLCRALASSEILGYPAPVLPGWNGKDELDAAVTHLAKVRTVLRYFDGLPPADDDDLVLIIDGYDIIMQLPPDVMIERYFAVNEAANARLDTRFGAMLARDRPRQTILIGPDKVCWPIDWRRPACWAVPEDTGIPVGAFGPVDDNDMMHFQPRWLNSGTIMGPVRDVREFFVATMERIKKTYDPKYKYRESDQMYMSDLWGEQEYARSVLELKLRSSGASEDGNAKDLIPEGGPKDRILPTIAPDQRTEYHVGLDYESALFQTRAGYEDFLDLLSFNGTGHSALVTRNYKNDPDFQPYKIGLPANVAASITRLLDSIFHIHRSDTNKLLAQAPLGTNLVTQYVYGLYHCTGAKNYLDELWGKMWFYPYAKSLLRASVKTASVDTTISDTLIDKRTWKAATTYPLFSPESEGGGEGSPGAWADADQGWLDWEGLCGEHEVALFGTGAS